MNIGTRRSDEVFTELGALVIAGLGTWTGGVRAAVLVGAAIGAERAERVTVELMGRWASATSVRLHPHSWSKRTRAPSRPQGSERYIDEGVSHGSTLTSRSPQMDRTFDMMAW